MKLCNVLVMQHSGWGILIAIFHAFEQIMKTYSIKNHYKKAVSLV